MYSDDLTRDDVIAITQVVPYVDKRPLTIIRQVQGSLDRSLITHNHSDHFGSAHELKEMLQVPMAIGGADARYLIEGKNAPVVPVHPRAMPYSV